MKSKSFSLKYMLLTYRLDMLWLPIAFWGLFLIIAGMIKNEPAGFPVTVAFLGVALPLIGGILGAYAVLEDPALELHFATPRPMWLLLLERYGMILVLLGICALTYQGVLVILGVDLAPLGGFAARQLAWLIPTLVMTGTSAVMAFGNRQPVAGAALTGMVFIIQVMLRDVFLAGKVGQYLLLMMGSNYPDHPALRANQVVLTAVAVVAGTAAWALLRRQERYI